MYSSAIVVLFAAIAAAAPQAPISSATTSTTTTTSLIGSDCASQPNANACCVTRLGSPSAYYDWNLSKCVLPASTSSSSTSTSTSVTTTKTTTTTPTTTQLIGGCGGTRYPSECCAQQLQNPNAVWDSNAKKCVIDSSCGAASNPNNCCVARFGPDNVWSNYYQCCVPVLPVTVTTCTTTIPCSKCAPTTVTLTSTTVTPCPPTITYTTIVPTTPPPPPPATTSSQVVPPPATTVCPAQVTVTQTETIFKQCQVTIFVPASSCFFSSQACTPSIVSTAWATPV